MATWVALVALAGCASEPAAPGGEHLRGLAAASLTTALGRAARAFAGAGGGQVAFSFEGSQQVVAHVRQGAPVDVVATASASDMATLEREHLVEGAITFARNRLEIMVAPGNPRHVTGLADLGRSDIRLVLAAPEVPVGHYAAEALERAAVVVHPRSLELDVKAAARRVTMGDADAAIVYATDVREAKDSAAGVAIPPSANVVATYRVAVVRASSHRKVARRFSASLLTGAGRQALLDEGFEAP